MKAIHRYKVLKVGSQELFREKCMYLVSHLQCFLPPGAVQGRTAGSAAGFSAAPHRPTPDATLLRLFRSATTAAGQTLWWTSTSRRVGLYSSAGMCDVHQVPLPGRRRCSLSALGPLLTVGCLSCRWAVMAAFPLFMLSNYLIRTVLMFKRGAIGDKQVESPPMLPLP